MNPINGRKSLGHWGEVIFIYNCLVVQFRNPAFEKPVEGKVQVVEIR